MAIKKLKIENKLNCYTLPNDKAEQWRHHASHLAIANASRAILAVAASWPSHQHSRAIAKPSHSRAKLIATPCQPCQLWPRHGQANAECWPSHDGGRAGRMLSYRRTSQPAPNDGHGYYRAIAHNSKIAIPVKCMQFY